MTDGQRDTRLATGLLWISPWFIGVTLFLLAPLALSLYYSFTEYPLVEAPVWVGLENYRELAGDAVFWIAVRNTAVYAALSVTLGNALALMLALLLNHRVRGVGLVRAAVFLPTLLPLVTASLAWMWMLNGEIGLINTALGWIGIDGPNWLADRRFALIAIVLVGLWNVGSAMVIYLAALQDVPRGLLEAAEIDGARAFARFRHVTLPMISPAVLFNVVVAIIWSLQVFAVPWIMTQGGPDNATRFYSMYVYENAFVYLRMGYASALGWIQFLLVLGLTIATLVISRRMVFYRGS